MNNHNNNIENLTHEEIAERFAKTPALVIPLGACEPFGNAGVLGVSLICAREVAREAAARGGAVCAPAVPFGCSAPFISFAGTMAVKPRTFVNMLCEIICGYVFEGAKRIFLINAAPFNIDPIMETIHRLAVKHPHVTIKMFDINAFGDSQFDRDDALLLSMFAYLQPNTNVSSITNAAMREDILAQYKTWKKRGKDPQKLRALLPSGLFATSSENEKINAEIGKENFERITAKIAAEISANIAAQ